MQPLVTVSRSIENSSLAVLNQSNPRLLRSLIDAASDLVIRYCHRDFVLTDYREYYQCPLYPNLQI